jgi:hypothetical protein
LEKKYLTMRKSKIRFLANQNLDYAEELRSTWAGFCHFWTKLHSAQITKIHHLDQGASRSTIGNAHACHEVGRGFDSRGWLGNFFQSFPGYRQNKVHNVQQHLVLWFTESAIKKFLKKSFGPIFRLFLKSFNRSTTLLTYFRVAPYIIITITYSAR